MIDIDRIVDIFFIIMMIGLVLFGVLIISSQTKFPRIAEEKCGEIGLELFDYSSGGLFTESSITCINTKTKEIIKIR